MNPTIKIILDTRRSKKETGKFPVKLRITFLKKQKHYPLNIDMTKEEFSHMQYPGKKGFNTAYKREIKEWKLQCDIVLIKANGICDQLPEFTFRLFESKLNKNQLSGTDVYECYKATINRLKRSGRIGTASNYESSLSSLKKFSSQLQFRDITIKFLNEYEE
jgi:hypothetical protein